MRALAPCGIIFTIHGRECTNPVKCQVKECGQRHATMLHEADWEGLREQVEKKGKRRLVVLLRLKVTMVTTLPVITMSWEARLPSLPASEGHQPRDRNISQDLCTIGQRVQCLIVSGSTSSNAQSSWTD